MAAGSAVRVRVPAKLNLCLRVGPRRADGFHDLVTVFHAVGLTDVVTASAVPPGTGVVLDVVDPAGGAVPGVPVDGSNLATRAAVALAGAAGIDADVRLSIRKAIPVAGGMAGGSADAAAALLACDTLWGLDSPPSSLASLAASLGSDVPFALRGGTAIGLGRGERLSTVPGHGRFHWVVVPSSGAGLSTPAVYSEFDRLTPAPPTPGPAVADDVVAACASGSSVDLAVALRNDLQDAALSLRPDLRPVLDAGLAAGASAGLVSGSGPTVVFLAGSAAAAAELAGRLGPAALATSGPVAGAAVVT